MNVSSAMNHAYYYWFAMNECHEIMRITNFGQQINIQTFTYLVMADWVTSPVQLSRVALCFWLHSDLCGLVLVLVELLAQAAVSQTEGEVASVMELNDFPISLNSSTTYKFIKLVLHGVMISSHNCTMCGCSQVETVGDMGWKMGAWAFWLLSLNLAAQWACLLLNSCFWAFYSLRLFPTSSSSLTSVNLSQNHELAMQEIFKLINERLSTLSKFFNKGIWDVFWKISDMIDASLPSTLLSSLSLTLLSFLRHPPSLLLPSPQSLMPSLLPTLPISPSALSFSD